MTYKTIPNSNGFFYMSDENKSVNKDISVSYFSLLLRPLCCVTNVFQKSDHSAVHSIRFSYGWCHILINSVNEFWKTI